jgi:hypothetical protein
LTESFFPEADIQLIPILYIHYFIFCPYWSGFQALTRNPYHIFSLKTNCGIFPILNFVSLAYKNHHLINKKKPGKLLVVISFN